ncbi:hypothetical protein BGZ51_007610 [Haplosporangium sp. Z 767]|nr:hypothetical protein BGZ50_007661 [Haplosporangium sp. Z 11]KAF9178626.1 hypothetical protein BGZ51_007610 [Haplosporangium sp. Z 767]
MEVLRDNFQKELPYIKEAIDECEFISIDAEFSGLHTEPNKRNASTTLEEGYEELRKSASKFLTIQIGISTFSFDPRNGSYLAKPFNFFIFPTSLTGYSPQGRCFLTEASSFDFLSRNRFDFNKWVYQGVHYMTKDEEKSFRAERIKFLNHQVDTLTVDPTMVQWIGETVDRIKAWKADPNAINFINIMTVNAYQRRLVYQEVHRLWPAELCARGQSNFINITKMTEKQFEMQQKKKLSDLERDIENSIGFRAVIDMLSACKKPIVGHNIVIDLAYILAQFVGPLPPTLEEYKKMIHDTFPIVMDTKYVSYTADALRGLAYDSTLGGLENLVGSVHFMGCPRVIPDIKHQRYFSRDLSHEAGYDAYITGSIMIRMLAFIARTEAMQQPEIQLEPNNNTNKRQKDQAAKKKGKSRILKKSPSPSPPAPVLAPPVKHKEPPAAPKKLSFADIVNRQKNAAAAATAKSPPTAPTPTPAPAQKSDQDATRFSEVSNDYDEGEDEYEESEESDYEFDQEPEPAEFERPFSIASPLFKNYKNMLHWGRSSHGCINLTSS